MSSVETYLFLPYEATVSGFPTSNRELFDPVIGAGPFIIDKVPKDVPLADGVLISYSTPLLLLPLHHQQFGWWWRGSSERLMTGILMCEKRAGWQERNNGGGDWEWQELMIHTTYMHTPCRKTASTVTRKSGWCLILTVWGTLVSAAGVRHQTMC